MDIPKIPGYDILELLPQGGMSAVFKARQISLDRVVVLKMLPPSMASDVVDIEKFLAEAKITAQLKHPNIVQVYDFGQSPAGIYYFVMEFVSGYSVADWIRRKKSLSIKDTLLCAHCVAEALSYSWVNFGVVHCDIKPDNIMIDGDGTVKVADLGLARSVRSVMDKAKFRAGIVVGTPYYISPEQSQGRLELDCRADIYSLGAMLYHCLTGKLPFEGLPPLEIMDCQITDQIPDLMDLQPQASMAVAFLIEKMMAKDPAHRQKDWQEVIRDMIRVRSQLLPEGPLVPAGASTMKRCPAREQWLKEQDTLIHHVFVPKSEALQALTEISAQTSPQAESPSQVVVRPWWRMKLEWLAAGIMVLAVVVSSLLVVNMLMKPKRAASPQDGQPGSAVRLSSSNSAAGRPNEQAAEIGLSGDASGEALAKTEALTQHRFEAAAEWSRANPGQFNEAIRQYAKIAAESKGTRYAQAAQDEIVRIRELERVVMAADMKALHDNVQPLLDRQKWREAAAIYEKYEGRFKTETAAERTAKVKEWIDHDTARQAEMLQAAEAQKQEQTRQWQDMLNNIAVYLVAGNPGAALKVVQQATNNAVLAAKQADLLTLANMLAEAGRADQRLLDSFRSQKDQEIVVALTNGPEHLVVLDVQDDTILVEQKIAVSAGQLSLSKVIRRQDLSLEEKKARLGTNATPETALVHGLVAIRDGDWAAAETSWSQAGPFLSAPLKIKLQERKSRQQEDQARSDFILLLRAAQVEAADSSGDVPGEALAKTEALAKPGTLAPAEPGLAKEKPLPGCEVCLVAIYQKKYLPHMAKVLAKNVAGYQEQYKQTEFAQAYAPALAALQQATMIASDSNKIASAESAPTKAGTGSPDGAVVCKDLFVRNPGLTELNVSLVKDGSGKIVRAELISVDLKDITPLAGLTDLCAVVCAAIRPNEWCESLVKAPLCDLSPLKGLHLQEVYVSHTQVMDLSPLAGMPLTKLDLTSTLVTDLSVLKGMPLRELTLSRLTIRDVKPLAGLPLEFLNIRCTEVADLTPLIGMKLNHLNLSQTRIRDLTSLAAMPLRELDLSKTNIRDLSPVHGLALEMLNVHATRVTDLNPLRHMPLKDLNISSTEVTDLSPLIGIELDRLNLGQTRIRDLTPLAAMPLRWLDLSQTHVRDLSPVHGVALEMLNVHATSIKDLDPLRDMPLQSLDISESDVRDLTPLATMPLRRLDLSKTNIRDLSPLQGLALEMLNLHATSVKDLDFLRGMPLKDLNISSTEVTNISSLTGMKLEHLDLGQTRVRNLAILAAMPLRGLNLSGTHIRDLSPVQGLALEMLNVHATRVKDLDLLRDMPLKWLDISESDVRDLSPLRGIPLKILLLSKTAVRDLAPIQNSPIEEIWLDYDANQLPLAATYRAFTTVLHRMPRLKQVNGNSNFRERR